MDWLDPERKTINNLPAYGNPAIAVLPRLNMMPKSHDLTEVSAVLAVGCNCFSEFKAFCDTRQIPSLLYRYHSDPEKFLEEFFGYQIPDKALLQEQKAKSLSPATKSGLTAKPPPRKTGFSRNLELNLDDLL